MPGTEVEHFDCVLCDDVVEGSPYLVLRGDIDAAVCEDCSGARVELCGECEEYHDTHNQFVYYYGDDAVCESCRDEHYFECETCEQLEHSDNMCSVGYSDTCICQNCYNDLSCCDHCGESVFEIFTIEDYDYCESCAKDNAEELLLEIRDRDYDESDEFDPEEDEEILRSLIAMSIRLNLFGITRRSWDCYECGTTISGCLPCNEETWALSSFVVNDGSTISGRCARCAGVDTNLGEYSQHKKKLNPYTYKPVPMFKRTESDLEKRALHFGTEVEIEMAGKHDDVKAALSKIGEADKEYGLFYCKQDACIKNGFEVVSHPFTLNWMNQHRDAFDSMFNLSEVMQGFEATSCGMHIHMSADAFTDLQMFKFMRWFYVNREYIRALSRRPKGKLEGWASMKVPDDKKMLSYALDKSKGMDTGRAALNVGSRQTIECRIFRSTLSPTTYYGNIEFLQSLFDYTRNSGIKNTRFAPYMEFVQARGSTYKNFLNLNEIIRSAYEMEGE